jgi:hypothetical protein
MHTLSSLENAPEVHKESMQAMHPSKQLGSLYQYLAACSMQATYGYRERPLLYNLEIKVFVCH